MPEFPLTTGREGIMAGKPLRCRLGMHKWVLQHEPETGTRFYECARCGKDRSPDGALPPIGMG